jgi:pSer/pThr/pTyr-binding forkhead associated (FHA) protein
MNTDITLLVLRCISASILLAIVGVLFIVLWRDFRSATTRMQANRRTHGNLVSVQEVNGSYLITGTRYPLRPLTSLGRAPTNSVPVDDDFASSEHALIALRNGQWWLEDRQSRNGTTLNELLITQPIVVTDGDIIGIGNHRFRLELER